MALKQTLRPRLRLKLKLVPVLLSVLTVAIIAMVIVSTVTTPQAALAGNSANYPNLIFHDPVLLRGTNGQVGAVYLFAAVNTGIDAQIEILDLFNGARIDDMDHFTAGYYAAWQPFVAAPGGTNNPSWIDWRITFKMAGTNVDTVLTSLAATAVDVDGDGAYLKELVEGDHVSSYAMQSNSLLTIIFNNDSCQATSTFTNIANIDTNRFEAMFAMTFRNVSAIEYRTGAISNYGGEEVRQNCIYFRYFDAMPPPSALPVDLMSFKAKSDQTKITLFWSTASEENNDFFTVQKSRDGKYFEDMGRVKGAGSTSQQHDYSLTDLNPFEKYNYYRLIQTDYDGKRKQYSPISVKLDSKKIDDFKITSALPNPFHDQLKINYAATKDCSIKVLIINETGATVYERQYNASAGNNSFDITNLSLSQKGIYFLYACYESERTPAVKLMRY